MTATLPDVLVDAERVRVQGNRHALIESRSNPGEWHAIEWSASRERWECSCKGFEVRKLCRHVKALDRWNRGEAVVEGVLLDALAGDDA